MEKVKIKTEQVSDVEIKLALKLIESKYSSDKLDTYSKLAALVSKTIQKQVTENRIIEYYLPSIQYEDRLLIAKEHWPNGWEDLENFVY